MTDSRTTGQPSPWYRSMTCTLCRQLPRSHKGFHAGTGGTGSQPRRQPSIEMPLTLAHGDDWPRPAGRAASKRHPPKSEAP